jgi:hypothetical protein
MNAVLKRCSVSVMVVAGLFFTGCSQSTTVPVNSGSEAKKPAGPPELASAKTAFWPMYTAARSWAPDLVVLRLTTKELPGFENKEGKAAMWEAMFASPSLHAYRLDTYAIANKPPDIYRGATAGLRLPWGGISRDAMPMDTSNFNVDSDAAYAAVVADPDAANWLKKNPDKKLSLIELGNVYQFHSLVWYLVWGDKKSGYAAYVDATSGKVLKSK